ncbi:MAG: FimV family protein [Bacteroidota bacterium]
MKSPKPPRPARRQRNIHVLPAGLALLAGIFAASPAQAVGFGEITLHSRIGENLLAEVPLIGGGKEIADVGCYRLAPLPAADLPVVSQARLRLIHGNNGYRLLIVGSKPISEPIFTISLRAACGLELRHDYVLMPDAPAAVADLVEYAAPGQGSRSSAPAETTRRPVRESRPNRAAPRQQRKADSAPRENADATETPPATLRAAGKPPKTARQPAGDRLMLGAPLPEPKPGENAAPPRGSIGELEERLFRMETSLNSLNQQMQTLDTSLKLTSEMQAARHELQVAQTLQQPAITAATSPPAASSAGSSAGNWLQLLLSSLLGGSIAVGIATLLGRRRA